jgi:hypothetical protein
MHLFTLNPHAVTTQHAKKNKSRQQWSNIWTIKLSYKQTVDSLRELSCNNANCKIASRKKDTIFWRNILSLWAVPAADSNGGSTRMVKGAASGKSTGHDKGQGKSAQSCAATSWWPSPHPERAHHLPAMCTVRAASLRERCPQSYRCTRTPANKPHRCRLWNISWTWSSPG